MKITSKICRVVGIINAWDYACPNGRTGKTYPYLYYVAGSNDRMAMSPKWLIYQEGKSFSDFWRDYGAMTFTVNCREQKQVEFLNACEWWYEKFGKCELVKTPVGSFMDSKFVEERNKYIELVYKKITDGEK